MSKAKHLEGILSSQPAQTHEFYKDIYNNLPGNYFLARHGICLGRPGPNQFIVVSSPFRVKERVQASKTKHWSRLIELINPAGELVDCILPDGKLMGKPREAITSLCDMGLQIYSDYHIKKVLNLVSQWKVEGNAFSIYTDKVGWVPDRDAFIFTDGHIMTRPDSNAKYRFGGKKTATTVGDLDFWRNNVSALAENNPNLIFGISIGFASALINFTSLNTSIFHLFGESSTGKTRILRAALSVWPHSDSEKTWEGSGNGLEGEIGYVDSSLLTLDDLRPDMTRELPSLIYKFANGSSKARGQKEGGARDRTTWKTSVLSSGETSFIDAIAKLGEEPTGGQGVRMLDIPAEGTYGVFDDLHGHTIGKSFVDYLDRMLKKASGPAGRAFVEQLLLLSDQQLEEELHAEMQQHMLLLQQHLDIIAEDATTAQVQRVLSTFAVVATAGEWATKWGLTGWTPGIAGEVVKTIAARWYDYRLSLPGEHLGEIKKIQNFLTENMDGFMSFVEAKSNPDVQLLGYRDDRFFYMLPATLEVAASDKGKALTALMHAGYLEKGSEKNSLQYKMPSTIPKRPRVYRIKNTLLDIEDKQEATRLENAALGEM